MVSSTFPSEIKTPPSLIRDILVVFLYALAYFTAQEISFLFPDAERVLSAIWPAGGIGLAALLTNRRQLWPYLIAALFVTGNAANLLSGRPLFNSLGFMTANMLESAASAWFLIRFCGRDIRFDRVREIAGLVTAAIVINAGTSFIGAGTAAIAHIAPFWNFWKTWWVVNGLGILLITPLIVSWNRLPDFRNIHIGRIIEYTAFFILWSVISWFAFNTGNPLFAFTAQPYILVALLAWAGLRMHQRAATIALVIMAGFALAGNSLFSGFLWEGEDLENHMLSMQLFISFTVIMGLLLSASTSEKNRALRMAHEDRLRIQTIGDNVPDGVIFQAILELDGSIRFTYASEGIERLTGISAAELLRDPGSIYRLIHEDDFEREQETEARAARELVKFDITYRMRTKNRGLRWMRVLASPRKLATGEIVSDGILFDVTAEKELEQKLIKSQKLESLGLLAGGVAHDFNNLLTPILGYTEIIQEDMPEKDPHFSQLENIKRAAIRAQDMTKRLLAFSRNQPIEPRTINLCDVITKSESIVRQMIRENIHIRYSLPQKPCTVMADSVQMEQLLINLVINGQDAMPLGGTLTVEVMDVEPAGVFNSLEVDILHSPFIMLRVSDTGHGMDEDTLSHIFEPFYSTREPGKVASLGMSTVYGIVKQNNGTIVASSHPDEGSVFTIYFPSTESIKTQADNLNGNGSMPQTRAGKILVVEDNEIVRSLTVDMVRHLGFEVLEAANVWECAGIIKEHGGKIKMLLTDVIMPGMNGKQLYESLAAIKPDLRVLYMSGYTSDIIGRHGIITDGIILIQKPFSLTGLAEKIDAVLAGG
ncbi:MAG: response regulator [Spirochaetaceae bacterium]|nr:MAG: response regulator [Spirochaetaceae bacterium]